jgi:hypothetical protein
MLSSFGFTMAEVPGTLWELMPFSWMFDYFSTVGAFLNDTFVVPPGTSKYCCLTKVYRATITERQELEYQRIVLPEEALLSVEKTVLGKLDFLHVNRSSVVDLPRVGVHFKSIDKIADNSLSKLLNLASLLGGRSSPILSNRSFYD